jgi:ribosome-associated protein
MKTKTCKITTPFIPATALLKLEGVEATGGQAAEAILQGIVKVNGVAITEKRKKIYPGSHVIIDDKLDIEVVSGKDETHKPKAD